MVQESLFSLRPRSVDREAFDLDRDGTSVWVRESFRSGLRSTNQIRNSECGAWIIWLDGNFRLVNHIANWMILRSELRSPDLKWFSNNYSDWDFGVQIANHFILVRTLVRFRESFFWFLFFLLNSRKHQTITIIKRKPRKKQVYTNTNLLRNICHGLVQ